MLTDDDPRSTGRIAEDDKRAATYSAPGSLKNAFLKLGFMPGSDEDAFAMLKSIIRENEQMRHRLDED